MFNSLLADRVRRRFAGIRPRSIDGIECRLPLAPLHSNDAEGNDEQNRHDANYQDERDRTGFRRRNGLVGGTFVGYVNIPDEFVSVDRVGVVTFDGPGKSQAETDLE